MFYAVQYFVQRGGRHTNRLCEIIMGVTARKFFLYIFHRESTCVLPN